MCTHSLSQYISPKNPNKAGEFFRQYGDAEILPLVVGIVNIVTLRWSKQVSTPVFFSLMGL